MLKRLVSVVLIVVAGAVGLSAQTLPAQITDRDFWRLITDLSEPDGVFQYENFVSNEDDYATVLSVLKQSVKPGGVFIGVGPEQNFTYITTFRPGIAFVVDIRRQNMLEHLLYKALFESSASRSEFVSKVFSRTPPAALADTSVATLFKAYEAAKPDQGFYDRNLKAIYDRLIETHGFPLSEDDKKGIAKVYNAFFQGGPQMDYRFASYSASTPSATYSMLMNTTDRDGRLWSFLSSDENFRLIQEYERKNLIVPLVGDFAGPKTIRAVGHYAREHGALVSVFYTSNVDEYLFRDTAKDRFFASVATLPTDASSAMIRALGGPGGVGTGPDAVQLAPGKRWASVKCSLSDLVKAFNAGNLQTRVAANRLCTR